MMNILCEVSTFDGFYPEPSKENIVNGVEFWTGKEIISYIIPKNINVEMENASYDNNKNEILNKVVIKNGKILSGGLDKGVFTKTSKGLIHTIYNDLGPLRTKDFINDLQKIVNTEGEDYQLEKLSVYTEGKIKRAYTLIYITVYIYI